MSDIWKRTILIVLVTVLVALSFYSCKADEGTVVIPEEQITDTNVIQNELGVNKQNAKEIVTQIKEIRTEKVVPVASYIEKSPTPVKAVQEKIDKKDSTLPPEALKDTDKTVVTTDGTKVDVYKINTYRNWELGVGVGRIADENIAVTSIQRNYDRCHSVQVEAYVNEKGFRGGSVQWKVHF